MIKTSDISNVLGQRLATLGYTIGWPNKDISDGTTHPYLIFDHVPVSRTDDTLRGGIEINTGFIMVMVMTGIGAYATTATEIAESIAALFPYALRLPVAGGEVTIFEPPQVGQGYPDEPHWRTPVKIKYSAS